MTNLKILKSASVILQRSSGEVFLVKRSRAVSFFPGFWVFPGGKIDEPLPEDWSGTEIEVIDTALRELYEEVGIVAGSDYTVPPDARSEPFFSQNYAESKRKQFLSDMEYIGKKQTPPFRRKLYNAAYFLISGELVDELKPVVDGGELEEGEWIFPETALEDWEQGKKRIPPPILHLLRNMASPHFASITLNETFLPVGLQTRVEFAPGYQLIPISSDTIDPFFNTNLTVIGNDELMIVDPGANNEGHEHLRELLLSLSHEPIVFVTHHHSDHWKGLGVVEQIYPNTTVYGHELTLSRISTELQKITVPDGYHFDLGTHQLTAIHSPGHTDGHMVLIDKQRGVLVAGDHVVGFGSAVLDPQSGSMIDYFASTRKLITLQPKLVLPAHGPPNFAASRLLEKYLEHRTEREDNILAAIDNGAEGLDEIVREVYTDVPEKMWPYAKRNIQLHIDKLKAEGKVPETYNS